MGGCGALGLRGEREGSAGAECGDCAKEKKGEYVGRKIGAKGGILPPFFLPSLVGLPPFLRLKPTTKVGILPPFLARFYPLLGVFFRTNGWKAEG